MPSDYINASQNLCSCDLALMAVFLLCHASHTLHAMTVHNQANAIDIIDNTDMTGMILHCLSAWPRSDMFSIRDPSWKRTKLEHLKVYWSSAFVV